MAELATIARPYAEALFRIARASNLNAWADALSVMSRVAAVPEVGAMARDPRVPRDVITKTFLDALKIEISAEAK
ncbi:MAG: F0F1 ATP synthase subunit delta, partial [Burkholderiaceae bacterium]